MATQTVTLTFNSAGTAPPDGTSVSGVVEAELDHNITDTITDVLELYGVAKMYNAAKTEVVDTRTLPSHIDENGLVLLHRGEKIVLSTNLMDWSDWEVTVTFKVETD